MTNHRNIIQSLLDSYPNKNYLEIGVGLGRNFLAIKASYKAGVDPRPLSAPLRKTLNENCVYHAMTSDDFFAAADKNDVKYDVIFIYGPHEYGQTYRDIVSALDHLAPDGVIVINNCKPGNEVMGLTPQIYNLVDPELKRKNNFAWVGDTWKAIVDLRSFHNDLLVFTLDCDWGCAVVTRGKPESMLGFSKSDIKAMEYSDLKKDFGGMLNLKHPTYLRVFMEKYRGIKSNYKFYVENIEEWIEFSEKDYLVDRPVGVQTIENGIILPVIGWNENPAFHEWRGGVCDADGNFVAGHMTNLSDPDSCENIHRAYPIPEKVRRIKETVVYGGRYFPHYGHFITETLSRMWYFVENPDCEYKVVFIGNGNEVQFIDFFLMLGLREENIMLLKEPTCFDTIIIPDQSMFLNSGYTGKAMTVYNAIRDSVTPAGYEKVYLTRSKLIPKQIVNEEYYEEYFRLQGYEVIAPEELSAREKVAVMAGAKEIATSSGTIHHQILFCHDRVNITLLARAEQPRVLEWSMNQARMVDCTVIDAALDALPTAITLGCHLFYPTDYFIHYKNDYGNGLYCKLDNFSLRNQAMEYIEAWSTQLANLPMRFILRHRNNTMADVIIGLHKLFGKSLDDAAVKKLKEACPPISQAVAEKEAEVNKKYENILSEQKITLGTLQSSLQDTTLERDELARDNNHITSMYESSQEALRQTEQERDELAQDNNRKASAIDMYENSMSWRLTAPFRAIRRAFEKRKDD
jgi:hypothetical protein